MAFINELTAWHWLSLGLILFALEALGVGGFLIGVALAALSTALLAWLGVSWQLQLMVFAVLACVFSVAYWKFFKNFNLRRDDQNVHINEKLESLCGKRGEVLLCTTEHSGKLKMGDTLWEFESGDVLVPADKVRVDSYRGMVLLVSKS